MTLLGAHARPIEIVLDISRLVSRIRHRTPTGVDRVEMAYATELMRRHPETLAFAALHPAGVYGRLPPAAARRFLAATAAHWEQAADRGDAAHWSHIADTLWRLRPRRIPRRRGPRVVVQSSPHHLHRLDTTRSILAREDARLVCLLHDLIPIEFPEYARPGGDRLHRRRMATVAACASGIVANSAATRGSFLAHLEPSSRAVPVAVAHLGLGTHPAAAAPREAGARAYFICLGTIEPRKNHLLLLHLWRDLAQRLGAANVPRLIVIGRRGWENEQVVDLLDRCPALVGCVEERAHVSDAELGALMAGACALLLPSFAEGFGMPVPEALAAGVPVICSDLPALREAGGDAAWYIDPLDGPAWRDAILALAGDAGGARTRLREKIAAWQPPTWGAHIDIVEELIAQVAG